MANACTSFIWLSHPKTIEEISLSNSGIFMELKSFDGFEKTELFSDYVLIELAG